MKKPNLLVIAITVAVIVLCAMMPLVFTQKRTIDADAPAVVVDEPSATAAPVTDATVQPVAEETTSETLQIEAYLIITAQGNIYEPLPLTGEGTFTLRQDETTYNTVHITPTSVWMEHSSCDNQDCVEQGVVSLDNMTERVLYNMIICLPNQISLELHTRETLMDAFGLTQ